MKQASRIAALAVLALSTSALLAQVAATARSRRPNRFRRSICRNFFMGWWRGVFAGVFGKKGV